MIQMQNISFAYQHKKMIFDKLSLTIQKGNIYGLLGRNGAGKSSLLRLMAGLLFPQQGTCTMNGIETKKRKIQTLEEIFFLTEEFHTPNTSIKNFIKIYSPFYPRFSHEKMQKFLSEFQLDETDNLNKLSYGQKKKALIAFGLATNVELLIFDEPTNGLDIPSKSQFRKLIADNMSDNQAIIISTHQVRDLDGLIDTIIILEDNAILLNRSLEEISEQFCFKMLTNTERIQDAIYIEQTLRGVAAMMPNLNNEQTKVDLELLFNAAMNKKQQIQAIFKTQLIEQA